MGFVAPAVSIIGGIAGIASKNAQAKEQRAQIDNQAYTAKVNEMASESMLMEQQRLSRSEYEIGTLTRLQNYSQAQAGLAAQQQMATLKAQQDGYNIQYQALQQRGQLDQQQAQLERQKLDTMVNADTKMGATATKEGGINSQLTANTLKEMGLQTEGDRKRISEQASGRMSSTSSLVRGERNLSDDISQALSQGLDTDRTSIQAYIQALSEEEQTILAERIGLNDNALNMDTVAANIRLAATGAEGALQQVDNDRSNTLAAADLAGRSMTIDANQQARSAQDAYRYQDYSLGMQRGIAEETGEAQQSSFQSASRNTKGAGFVDYLNLGVSTYGAVSPLLNRGASAGVKAKEAIGTPPGVKYSGFVPTNRA